MYQQYNSSSIPPPLPLINHQQQQQQPINNNYSWPSVYGSEYPSSSNYGTSGNYHNHHLYNNYGNAGLYNNGVMGMGGYPVRPTTENQTVAFVSALIHSFSSFAALLENTFNTSVHSMAALTAVGHQLSSLFSPLARFLDIKKTNSPHLVNDSAISLLDSNKNSSNIFYNKRSSKRNTTTTTTLLLWFIFALAAPIAATKAFSLLFNYIKSRNNNEININKNNQEMTMINPQSNDFIYLVAIYDLPPDSSKKILGFQTGERIELLDNNGYSFKKNDLKPPIWLLGRCIKTGIIGYFPTNYVSLEEEEEEENNNTNTFKSNNNNNNGSQM